jgi:hypothetical protein
MKSGSGPDLARAVAHLEKGDWRAAHGANARYWYREAERAFPREPSPRDEIEALKQKLTGI